MGSAQTADDPPDRDLKFDWAGQVQPCRASCDPQRACRPPGMSNLPSLPSVQGAWPGWAAAVCAVQGTDWLLAQAAYHVRPVKCCCRRLSSNSCCRVCQTPVFGTQSLRGSLLAQASKSHTYNVEVGCPQAGIISEPSCLEPSQYTALLPRVFDACLAGNCTGPAGQPWACLHSRAQHACKEDRQKVKLESICRWRSQRRTHQTRL